MHLSARKRIICFKVEIPDDLALMGAMRMEPMQRYYHSRHGNDYMFAEAYREETLKEHFRGKEFEIIDIKVHKAEPYVAMKKILGAFSDALAQKSKLRREFLRQSGSSGTLYRAFINNYFRLAPGSRYLELGAGDGTAFVAALHGNSLQALAVDDWEGRDETRAAFMRNILCVSSPASRFGMLDKQLGPIFGSTLGPRNAVAVSGNRFPIEARLLDEIFEANPLLPPLLSISGWNIAAYRRHWTKALEESRFEPAISFSIITSFKDVNEQERSARWGDGYFIALLAPRGKNEPDAQSP